jgi:hypothetical protein
MLKVTGIMLNVVGLAITLVGIVRESRERRAPLLRHHEAALVHRVRRALGLQGPSVHMTAGAAVGQVEMWANAIVQSPRNPDDPVDAQLEAIEKNFDAKLDGLKSQMNRNLELQGRRMTELADQHSSLAERVAESEQADREATSNSLRLETFGIALALLGTSLSAFD